MDQRNGTMAVEMQTPGPSTAEPVLLRLGRWVAGLDYSQLDDDTLRAARLQVLNMIATAHAGRRSRETNSVGATLAALSAGAGRSTVLGVAARHAPHDAAAANAAYSMAQDFDDIVWMGHTCHSAVWASLAVAEHERADARAFLTAVVAANEVGGRLGASSLFGPLNGQMWTFIHLVGAAAASAKLLGLDAEGATHALAIALAQPNFALQPGFLTPTSKLLAAATPTATGIRAAYFAREGMTGEPTIVEDPRGFWARFSYLPLPGMMDDLGQLWCTQTLSVKTYPGCHYFQTACSAIDRLVAGRPWSPDQIHSVRIDTTKLAIEATRFAGEYAAVRQTITPVNVNFDLKVTAAIMLLAGQLTSAEVEPSWLAEQSEAIVSLRRRITVRHAPELTLESLACMAAVGAGRAALRSVKPRDLVDLVQRYRREYRSELLTAREAAGWLRALGRAAFRRAPGRAGRGSTSAIPLHFPNRVTIELSDGSTLCERVDLPVGSFCSPQMPMEVEAKFLREAGASLGPSRARDGFAAGLALGRGSLESFLEAVA